MVHSIQLADITVDYLFFDADDVLCTTGFWSHCYVNKIHGINGGGGRNVT